MQRVDTDDGVTLRLVDQPHGLRQSRERSDHGEFERAGEAELAREITGLDEIVALPRPVE